jgi:hypothetical protein
MSMKMLFCAVGCVATRAFARVLPLNSAAVGLNQIS